MNRNPYTTREVRCLVQYIAQYQPEVKGRLGTKLYQMLVENPKKWPWGRTHSWQSWREHYKKNQEEIDRQVRLHQKEVARKGQGGAEAEPVRKEGNEESDKRRTVENEKKTTKSFLRDQPVQSGVSRPQGTKDVERIAHERNASKNVHPVKVAAHSREVSNDKTAGAQRISKSLKVEPEESANEPTAPLIHTLTGVIDLIDKGKVEEDIMHDLFGTSEEEEEEGENTDQLKESPAPLKIRAAEPSKTTNIQEVVPGTPQHEPEFSQEPIPAQKSIIEDVSLSVELPVPPQKPKVRRKRVIESPDPFQTGSSSSPDKPPQRRSQAVLNTRDAPPVLVTGGFRTVLKRPRRSSTGNEDGRTWPPKRAKKFHGDEQAMEVDKPQSDKVSSPPVQELKRGPVQVQVNAFASSSSTGLPVDLTHDTAYTRDSITTKKKATKTVSSKLNAPAVPRASSTFAPPEIPVSVDDPFIGKAVNNVKGKSRAEFAINPNPPPRIDFHQQLLKRNLTNTSGSASGGRESRRSSFAPSVERLAARPSLIETDKFSEIARQETINKLALMASERGIDFEFAHGTYLRMKNLEDTEFILQKVYERNLERRGPPRISFAGRKAQRTSGVVRVNGEPESSDEVPQGLVRRPSSTASRTRGKSQQIKQPRKRGRPSLVIRPIPTGDEPYYVSDYSPPNKTRAGQFARLERQGRRDEALEREKKRVSGFYVPETQVSLQKAASPQPSEGSPSPKGKHGGQSVPHLDGMEVVEQREPDVDTQEDLRQREMELDQYINHVDEEELEDAAVQPEIDEEETVDEQDVADALSQIGLSDDEDESNGEDGMRTVEQPEDGEDDIYMPEEASIHEADDESDDSHEGGNLGSSPVDRNRQTLRKRLLRGREGDPALATESKQHRQLILSRRPDVTEIRAFEENHTPDLLRHWSIKWMRELKDIGPSHMLGDNATE